MVVELLLGRSQAGAMLRGARAIAPHHLDVEVLSALHAMVRRAELGTERARLALRRLATAAIERVPLTPLLDLRDNLSAYDAVYVALARQLGCPLLTADRRLAAAPDLGIAVTVV